MNSALIVRPAEVADVDLLVDFNIAMALETEDKVLDPAVLRGGIRAVFEQPAHGRYWVVERAGTVVGGLLLTYEWSDWRNGLWWWIQSVYVVPAARRGGVFRTLYRQVEAAARATPGVVGLRLYVERDNRNAQATYLALGMVDSHYMMLQSEFGAG
jgi:GNAT superfamily N-acetyltransferase